LVTTTRYGPKFGATEGGFTASWVLFTNVVATGPTPPKVAVAPDTKPVPTIFTDVVPVFGPAFGPTPVTVGAAASAVMTAAARPTELSDMLRTVTKPNLPRLDFFRINAPPL
jgi:hypothetical protein